MSHFDDFFRANYRRMVGYCSGFGFREPDVEEEVADVILKYYDEYRAAITGPSPDDTMRHWMNRRVLLNLRSKALRFENARTDRIPEHFDQQHVDDPESILDLKQRLPEVHPILIRYESYAGGQRTRGMNTSADKTRFCRERKKFLAALEGDSE